MNLKEKIIKFKNNSKSNILIDNVLIALFMDINPIEGFCFDKNEFYYYYNNSKTKDFEGLPDYKNSWDDLMPVVEKINKHNWVTIFADECKIHSLKVGEFEDIIITKEGEPLINSVYCAVLEYIKMLK
jgi:hypothetical protein